jgi:MFS family permease
MHAFHNDMVKHSGSLEANVSQSPADMPRLDDAWSFLNSHAATNIESSTIDMNKLRRKIDWHIVPLMFLCYTMQFLDKVILNYAAVMGLQKDLKLKGNEFSNIATFLFVGLLCFEVPNSTSTRSNALLVTYSTPVYFLQMIPAAKWLGLNVILWGTATACGAASQSYRTLLVSRVFLGIFEATIGPSLLLISSQWYTKSEQAPRFSFWYCGLGIGQILGGAISYGFQQVAPSSGLAGWRVMFIVLGCVTVAIGLATILFIPDTPMKARWLSDAEKFALLKHVSVNMTGIQNRKFQPMQIVEALLDPQLYLMVLTVILVSVAFARSKRK